MEGIDTNTKIAAKLADYFTIETKLFSTRTADLYIAQDLSKGGDVSLWQLRAALPEEPGLIQDYLNRLEIIANMNPSVSDMRGHGVDIDGVGFAIISRLDGNTLTEGNPEISEIERRFESCIELVSRLHAASILCGDICKNSFWLNRAGSVRFVGVMGAFEDDPTQGLKVYPEGHYYRSPEQIETGQIDLRTDVYALGVLGYFMITGMYPENETEFKPPSKLKKNAPHWADIVLTKALKQNPDDRYADGLELLEALRELRESHAADPKKGASGKMFKEDGSGNSPGLSTGRPLADLRQAPLVKKIMRAAAIVVLIAIGMVVLLPAYTRYANHARLSHALEAHKAIAGEQLRVAIDGLLTSGSGSLEKKPFLTQIINSEDPVAHAVLVTLSRNTTLSEVRKSCEDSILERAKRSGLIRGADVAGSWLERYKGDRAPPGYAEEVLLTLDGSLPADARSKGLRRVYAENWLLAVELAAAFALDSEHEDDYRPVLAQLLGDKLRIQNAEDHSALALILSSATLSDHFGGDVIDRREKLPDADLLWLLQILTDRDDGQIHYLTDEILKRKLIPKPRDYFLDIVNERQDLPTEVLKALVNAAQGKLKPEDIASFGRWYDNSIEDILLAICASEHDPDVLYETFDTVASRSLLNDLIGHLVDWIKTNYWDNRLEFVRGLGVLSQSETATPAEIQDGLSVFDRYIIDKDVLGPLLLAKSSNIVVGAIQRYQEVIPISDLLILLSDHEKKVKLAAIKALSGSNDVGAFQIVIANYQKETDPEVRKAYEENFWVVKQRLNK